MLLLNFASLMSVLIISTSLPLENSKDAKILEYVFDKDVLGNYEFGYETDNNIIREEKGEIVEDEVHNATFVVRGSYSYIGNDGEKIDVFYVADENGFHPTFTIRSNATADDKNKFSKEANEKSTDKNKSSKKANETSTRSRKKN